MLRVVLMVIAVWTGLSVACLFTYALGVGAGRRRGWEAGYWNGRDHGQADARCARCDSAQEWVVTKN